MRGKKKRFRKSWITWKRMKRRRSQKSYTISEKREPSVKVGLGNEEVFL